MSLINFVPWVAGRTLPSRSLNHRVSTRRATRQLSTWLVAFLAGFSLLLFSCGSKPVVFNVTVPAETPFGLDDEEIHPLFEAQLYIPGDDAEYLVGLAKVVIPAFNERRKLTKVERDQIATLTTQVDAKDRLSAKARFSSIVENTTWLNGVSDQYRFDQGVGQIQGINAAVRKLILDQVRTDFESDALFNQYLGSLLDRTEVYLLMAFNDQVLKMEIAHPDTKDWPVVIIKDFKVLYGHQGKTTGVNLVVPKVMWPAVVEFMSQAVALGKDKLEADPYAAAKTLKSQYDEIEKARTEAVMLNSKKDYVDGSYYAGSVTPWTFPELAEGPILFARDQLGLACPLYEYLQNPVKKLDQFWGLNSQFLENLEPGK